MTRLEGKSVSEEGGNIRIPNEKCGPDGLLAQQQHLSQICSGFMLE